MRLCFRWRRMKVDVFIDNGDARIRITQIFANHTDKIEEGTYVFALPDRSTVSDFAVWDGPVRIPAVILERKRAGEIYEEAKSQAIDPWPAADGRARGYGREASLDFQRKDRSHSSMGHQAAGAWSITRS